MARIRRTLYQAWREAEGRHDLLVANFFYAEPGSFSVPAAVTTDDFREIARLRNVANAAHEAWLRDLIARDADPE